MENKIKKIEKAICPNCQKPLDAATSAFDKDAVPEAGDISICVYCQSVNRFMDDFTLRALDEYELELLIKEMPELSSLIVGIKKLNQFFLKKIVKKFDSLTEMMMWFKDDENTAMFELEYPVELYNINVDINNFTIVVDKK